MKRLIALTIILTFVTTALAAGLVFIFSADSGVTKWPTGLTDAKFPPPKSVRDPLVQTALVFDVLTRPLVSGHLGSPAVQNQDGSVTPAVAAVADSWGPWTPYRKYIVPSVIFSIEPGRDEMSDYVRLEVSGGSLDNGLTVEAAVYYVRGDFATICALVDKARGANSAWNVTFDEKH